MPNPLEGVNRNLPLRLGIQNTEGRDDALTTNGHNFSAEGRKIAQDMFIEAYLKVGTILAGCRAAGIGRETYVYWMAHYPDFKARFQTAVEEFNDKLREEITKRATVGVDRVKRVYYKGELVDEYIEKELSDNLLLAQARARMREYRTDNKEQDGDEEKLSMGVVAEILAAGKPADEVVEGPSGPAPGSKKEHAAVDVDAHADTDAHS